MPKIQQVGSILIKRLRKHDIAESMLDKQLLGTFISDASPEEHRIRDGPARYLALLFRFAFDMVAYYMCEFGGGVYERSERHA